MSGVEIEDQFFREAPDEGFERDEPSMIDDKGTDLNVSFYEGQENASFS